MSKMIAEPELVKVRELEQSQAELKKENDALSKTYAEKIAELEKQKHEVLQEFVHKYAPYAVGDILRGYDGNKYKVTQIIPSYSEHSDFCGITIKACRIIHGGKRLSANSTVVFKLPISYYKKV